MAVLTLGVLDVQYSFGGKSTGDVAEILEDKYGIFQHFWQAHGTAVMESIAEVQSAALEAMVASDDPAAAQEELRIGYLGVEQEVKVLFDKFITMKEMDGMAEGVPTQASLEGVSHRFKNKKGAPGRASFYDTGLLLSSMMAKIE